MDNELKHIITTIDEMIYAIKRSMKTIERFDYSEYGIAHEIDHWLYLVYVLNAYTRALDHKLNESYKAIIESRDNGDME
jgi:hypothetical protein